MLTRLSLQASGFHMPFSLRKKGAKAVSVASMSLADEFKLAAKDHASIEFTQCDVTKWSDLQNVIDVSVDKFGVVLEVFVLSAGVFERAGMLPTEVEERMRAQRRRDSDIPGYRLLWL